MKNLMLILALVAFIGVSMSPVKALAVKHGITVVDNDKDKDKNKKSESKTDKKDCEKKCDHSKGGDKKGCCANKDAKKCNHEGEKKSCGHGDSKGNVTPEKK